MRKNTGSVLVAPKVVPKQNYNAMIELITGKYYVVPRTTIKNYSMLEIQNEFEGFDNVQQAYEYAIKLQPDWYMK